jgi:hypothetical protein
MVRPLMTDDQLNAVKNDPRFCAQYGLSALGTILRGHLSANFNPPADWLNGIDSERAYFTEGPRLSQAHQQCSNYWKPLPYERRAAFYHRMGFISLTRGVSLPREVIQSAYNSWVVMCPQDWPMFPNNETLLQQLQCDTSEIEQLHRALIQNPHEIGTCPKSWRTEPLVWRHGNGNQLSAAHNYTHTAEQRYAYQLCCRYSSTIPLPHEDRQLFYYRQRDLQRNNWLEANSSAQFNNFLTTGCNIHILPMDQEGQYVRQTSEAMTWTRNRILAHTPSNE